MPNLWEAVYFNLISTCISIFFSFYDINYIHFNMFGTMFFGDQIGKRKRNTFYSLYCVLKHDFLFLILLLIILLVFFF